jgi:signal-transduction protein with cAMP-binding, CBS, and nucleotidyltransferase domain
MKREVIKAREVMREKHLEMEGSATVKEALEAMQADKADVLIVKKRDEHDAFGIVLLSDIAKNVLAKDRAADRVNVYEIMSKPVIPVDPEMDVRYCARMFERFGLSNAPVLEHGEVIGIVSYNELVFDGLCQLMD